MREVARLPFCLQRVGCHVARHQPSFSVRRDDFLKAHAATLWQCDCYSKKVLTWQGFRALFLLVFPHVQTRRVFISPATFHPNEPWIKQQADAFLRHVHDAELGATIVMHDRDTKFTASFDQILEGANLEVKLSSYRSPNTNAFVERFIQTLQQECLDYFVVFGQRHMDHLVAEMVSHYHEECPYQAKDNAPLNASMAPCNPADRRKDQGIALESQPVVGRIRCRERLGVRLKHYYRHAG